MNRRHIGAVSERSHNMNAIEIKGLKKVYDNYTLGPIDLTLPQG